MTLPRVQCVQTLAKVTSLDFAMDISQMPKATKAEKVAKPVKKEKKTKDPNAPKVCSRF